MTENEDKNYTTCAKKVWGIYAILVVVLIVVLVTLVAQDDEERLFYSLMTVAASYVLRPSDRLISKYVLRIFGVAPADKSDD